MNAVEEQLKGVIENQKQLSDKINTNEEVHTLVNNQKGFLNTIEDIISKEQLNNMKEVKLMKDELNATINELGEKHLSLSNKVKQFDSIQSKINDDLFKEFISLQNEIKKTGVTMQDIISMLDSKTFFV